MDDRLAHIRALVENRWREAREMQRQNDLLAHRVEALKHYYHDELVAHSVACSAAVTELEKEIAVESAVEKKRRLELVNCENKRERFRTRARVQQLQVALLKAALQEEQMRADATWTEFMADREILSEEDNARAEKEREGRQAEEQLIEGLQTELEDLEAAIAVKKIETDHTKSTLHNLKRRKHSLERQIEHANAENASLKARLAKLRSPNYAAAVEEGIDAILRELDDIGAP